MLNLVIKVKLHQMKLLRLNLAKFIQIRLFRSLVEILSFITIPCATMCYYMLPMTINDCLCNYYSNLDRLWSSFQLVAIMTYFMFSIG
jgi:hypothetical protein